MTRSDSLRSEIQVHNARLAVLQASTSLEDADAALTRAVGTPYLVTAAADESLPAPVLALDDQALRTLALEGPAVQEASAPGEGWMFLGLLHVTPPSTELANCTAVEPSGPGSVHVA